MAVDVHPPEHPIRSVKDFLIQIVTVTIGILIALSLEGLIEHRRDAELVAHARAQFRAELQTNLDHIRKALETEKSAATWMDNTIAYLKARQNKQAAKDAGDFPALSFNYTRGAAWDSALAVGAIRLLTPRETQTLSRIYNAQTVHTTITTEMRERLMGLNAFADTQEVTPEEAPPLLQNVRILKAYAATMIGLEDQMVAQYQEALDAIQAATSR
jgi:hypothetical protein